MSPWELAEMIEEVEALIEKAEKIQFDGVLLTIAMNVLRSSGAPQGMPMHI